jgi:nitrobenzene nitroreductase
MTIGLQKEVAGSERSPFYIDELIRGRRTKRGFTNKAVPIDLVRDILSISKFAPSSSTTQPWQCYVLTAKPVSGSLLPPPRLSTKIRRV